MAYAPNRPNKIAAGITKNELRRKKFGKPERNSLVGYAGYTPHNADILRLSVKGTLDELTGNTYYMKRVKVLHPTDYGYSKEVFVLNDSGRSKLKRMRYEQNENKK